MEEQSQKECKAKKCCVKGIIIVIVCSLICFFIGYYAGSKSLAKVSGAAVNRPFNPRNIPRIPKFPNIPKNIPKSQIQRSPNVQRPPVPPNVQAPKVNIPEETQKKLAEKANAQATNNTENK